MIPRRADGVMIAPSVLNSDLTRLADSLAALEQADADYVHLDVMDGRYVPNISIGIPVVASINEATRLPLDVHLMIVEPERYVDAFVDAGADIVTVHVEATTHPHRVLQQIRELGARSGLALNPGTPVEHAIELLPVCDLVLIMSVNPGFGGQTFIPASLRRLSELRAAVEEGGYSTIIEIDGGISSRNIRKVVEAGAEMLVAGTAVFGDDEGVTAAVQKLRSAAAG
jgi:ribulose-phosphate 3-epimerase